MGKEKLVGIEPYRCGPQSSCSTIVELKRNIGNAAIWQPSINHCGGALVSNFSLSLLSASTSIPWTVVKYVEDTHRWQSSPAHSNEQLTRNGADVFQLFCQWLGGKDDRTGAGREKWRTAVCPYAFITFAAQRPDYRTVHIGTNWHNEAKREAHTDIPTRRSLPLQLPGLYWRVMESVGGVLKWCRWCIFLYEMLFHMCSGMILASQSKCNNSLDVLHLCVFYSL